MIINLQTGKSSPSKRVEYLIHGVKEDRDLNTVHILEGDPELFEEIAKHNPYKTKTYNYLISFEESKEELEEKLAEQGKTIEDLYQEVFSFSLPAEYYPRESLNVLAIAHSDTDHFHIHLTVENYDHLKQKSLYIPKTKTEIEFYRALERYIKTKYNLSFGKLRTQDKGKAGTEKIKQILFKRGKYGEKTRDETKEELTNLFIELIRSGEIESRDDLIANLLSIDGVELHRIGKNYISIRLEGQKKSIRLKGGIYDESKFNELKEYIKTNKRKSTTLGEERELLEDVRRKRESYIAQRRQKHDLERVESVNQEHSWSKNRREPEQSTKNLVDRIFPFDWTSVIYSAISPPFPDEFSFSLPAESDKRTGSEDMHSSTRDSMSIWQQRLDRLSSYSYSAVKFKETVTMRKKVNEIRKLELEYLKNIDPENVLSVIGITDWQEKNGYLLMKSPLREDNNPSFEVFYGTERSCWMYFDFGTGWRGTSIDLWQEVKNVDYREAVQEMRKTFGINLLENKNKNLESLKQEMKKKIQSEQEKQAEKRKRLAKQEKDELKKVTHRILKIKEPEDKALFEYLEKRGIKETPSWLKEVRYLYLPKKKHYFALAVQDQNGVWHARNTYGKVNILTAPEQKPTYSLIKREAENKTVVVVEGLFDALTLNQELKKPYDIVILNSTTNTERLIKDGILSKYKTVILALDDDKAGRKAEKELYKHLKQLDDVEIGKLTYSAGEDINECYLKGGNFKIPNITPKRYWIGKNFQRVVITDKKKVLEKLGIEESRIKRVNCPGDIAKYWEEKKCKGDVELYLSKAEDWIYTGLKKAVWEEVYMPAYSTIKEKREHRPTKVYKGKYWKLDGDIVLDEDVFRDPEKYLYSQNEEIKKFAKKVLKQTEDEGSSQDREKGGMEL